MNQALEAVAAVGVLLTTLALTDSALAYELETTQAVSCVALPLKPY